VGGKRTRRGWENILVAAEGADRKSEQRVILSQELGSTGVESGGGGEETSASANLVNGEVVSELASHKEEEGEVEEGEEDDQGNVDPQSCQDEDEGDDKPSGQKDSDSAGQLTRGIGVRSRDTKRGVEEGSVGHPETTVRGEGSRAKGVTSGELPHSSSKLGKTTDETGHANHSIGDGNAAGLDVVHGEDEGGGGEGEETERSRVGDYPQLGGGVVNIGLDRESTGGVSSATVVVVFVADDVVVVDGTLLVREVAHDGEG